MCLQEGPHLQPVRPRRGRGTTGQEPEGPQDWYQLRGDTQKSAQVPSWATCLWVAMSCGPLPVSWRQGSTARLSPESMGGGVAAAPAFLIDSHVDLSISETGGNQEGELWEKQELASWCRALWEVQHSHVQAIATPPSPPLSTR